MSKNNFNAIWTTDYLMSSNGMFCGFNMPPALKGEDVHALPPNAPRKPFLVDDYPAAPANWMRSEGRTASYFLAIKKDYGMWLDFNKNQDHKYDVAVVISVQGINPITGLPCDNPGLEQYIDNCPKCKEKFEANRYCKKCEMHWPKQNYISTTAQPNGHLWLDGFKMADNVVRQYLFTEEAMKGVASNIIGKDRVYAIGIKFYLSKTPKAVQEITEPRGMFHISQSPAHTPINWQIPTKGFTSKKRSSKGGGSSAGGSSAGSDNTYVYTSSAGTISGGSGWQNRIGDYQQPITQNQLETVKHQLTSTANDPILQITCSHTFDTETTVYDLSKPLPEGLVIESPDLIMGDFHRKTFTTPTREVKVAQLEVGAGARINQKIYDDPEPLSYWRDEAESIIVINYGLEEDIQKILDAGKRNKKIKQEGFLQGMPVGN